MFRRLIGGGVLAGFLMVSGCIAVVGNKGLAGTRKQAVVLDGQVYIVDTKTGSVMRIQSENVADAAMFVPEKDED